MRCVKEEEEEEEKEEAAGEKSDVDAKSAPDWLSEHDGREEQHLHAVVEHVHWQSALQRRATNVVVGGGGGGRGCSPTALLLW